MNRYLLFAGDHYYPCGGIRDYVGAFSNKVDAINAVVDKDWWHVLDTETMTIVTYGEVYGSKMIFDCTYTLEEFEGYTDR
jgi:hypothetical protein